MSRVILALSVVLLVPVVDLAQKLQQPQGMESGFYKLTFHGHNWNGEEGIIVLLRRKGDSLELLDLLTNSKYKAKIVEYRPWGMNEATLRTASFELPGSDPLSPASRLNFATSNNGGLMATWEYKDQQAPIEVRSISSLWACGNHENPIHTAESEAEMNRKTQRYGCTGWHQLKESNVK